MFRYKTFLESLTRIYSAGTTEQRSQMLRQGLDEVVTVANPLNKVGWRRVASDSHRLLVVWAEKEKSDTTTGVVVGQIMELLNELAEDDEIPALVVKELSVTPVPVAVGVSVANTISSAPAPAPAPAPILVVVEKAEEEETEAEEEETEAEEEEAEEEETEAEEEEEKTEAEEEKTEAEEEETEAEEEEAEEEEAEEEKEEVEAEEEKEEEAEEEEDEEADEVRQIHIRGRSYWLDSSNKIYAVVGDDDVGDVVGELVNGKPQFLAK